MPQQATIPRTLEEVAASLSQLTEKDQCIVKGMILGLNEAHRNAASPPGAELAELGRGQAPPPGA